MDENGVHKPRLCKVVKRVNGYGFHLHGEKGKVGQRIRKVESGSAAEDAGLKMGDKIVCVNGTNVEKETHQEVVKRIKEKDGETEMLVVDEETEKYFKDKEIPITLALLTNGTEATNGEKTDNGVKETPKPVETNSVETGETLQTDGSTELRPRLCNLEKGAAGYGFNLHSEKGKPGRYIRSVDDGSPAQQSGMKAGDRIIEVNDVNMEFEKHAKLVTTVKESGGSVKFLVVDEATDNFFKSCEVTPTTSHLTGPLPTPKPQKAPEAEADMMTMDLTALKERSQASRKKRPSAGDWQKRQAMFNEL